MLGRLALSLRGSIVLQLRRLRFMSARFQPQRVGCFSELYAYSWSCDRHMQRYSMSATANGAPRSIRQLRQLALQLAGLPQLEAAPPPPAKVEKLQLAARLPNEASRNTDGPEGELEDRRDLPVSDPPRRTMLLYGR